MRRNILSAILCVVFIAATCYCVAVGDTEVYGWFIFGGIVSGITAMEL